MEKYTGVNDDKRYEGDNVDITYNVKRCIHAAQCVQHLSEVFDTKKRPWINANGSTTEKVATTIELCPSGALHYDRKDGVKEIPAGENTIRIQHNGPLEIRGDLAIQGATVDVQSETRVTLCRCGESKNKPFCDNTHKEIGFEAVETDPIIREGDHESGGKLTIIAHANGPLELQGNLHIIGADGETLFRGTKTWLCRCGGSAKKPFCDSTHKKNGFTAE
ncbi:MAG: CDGSH iron-sulfur domain-containing protein [Anaerolineae bacterium]|jgi:CDGSH-type Zn-finger protein/uncharacterized Fe-S cluster protein YjdI|nr:CDGSH iron-sulfur domain-containing protein [Anaerolineae bacterium]